MFMTGVKGKSFDEINGSIQSTLIGKLSVVMDVKFLRYFVSYKVLLITSILSKMSISKIGIIIICFLVL